MRCEEGVEVSSKIEKLKKRVGYLNFKIRDEII